MLRLREDNLSKIVQMKNIGAIAVIGVHPDPLLASQQSVHKTTMAAKII
jgi:hypothetical protein